ncbi:MAG: MucR family transcriptional regulator [Roseiarcus sp.]
MADERSAIELMTEIAAAYVSKNSVRSADLPALVSAIHDALQRLLTGAVPAEPEKLTPAAPIKKSVTPEYIICLEDGRKFRSLKRHLRTAYNLSPEEYRAKWGLPNDYPMVAPAYAKARSALAVKMGLGQKRRKPRK